MKKHNEPEIQSGVVIETRPNGRKRVRIFNTEPSMTQQQFKDETDVNNIMRKYIKTGQITHLNNRKGAYADLSDAKHFEEAMTVIARSQQAFEQLPSHVRARFGNDPQQMLSFIHDKNNYDEGVKLGIFDPKLPAIGADDKKTKTKNSNDETTNDE